MKCSILIWLIETAEPDSSDEEKEKEEEEEREEREEELERELRYEREARAREREEREEHDEPSYSDHGGDDYRGGWWLWWSLPAGFWMVISCVVRTMRWSAVSWVQRWDWDSAYCILLHQLCVIVKGYLQILRLTTHGLTLHKDIETQISWSLVLVHV